MTELGVPVSAATIKDPWTLKSDLASILTDCQNIWPELKGASLFITGGTGFIGCWLLESLKYANEALSLDIQATVLTRDAESFRHKAPHLRDYRSFTFQEGDVTDFETPKGEFTHVIHAATDASAYLNEHDPITMFNTIVEGTKRTLNLCVEKKVERVLFLSSGAVYGQQPWDLTHVSEEWLGAPNCLDARATYAEAKRAAEMLCAIYQKQFGLKIAISRIFALLGPYLSLGIHFAAGNFIQDAMAGKRVIINGNGLPCRSYLYAADLTTWLWHMLVRADSGRPYNCGSDESISVEELASRVAKTLSQGDYEVLGAEDRGWNLGRYVPETRRIENELGLKRKVSLEEAIIRTASWHGWKGKTNEAI